MAGYVLDKNPVDVRDIVDYPPNLPYPDIKGSVIYQLVKILTMLQALTVLVCWTWLCNS